LRAINSDESTQIIISSSHYSLFVVDSFESIKHWSAKISLRAIPLRATSARTRFLGFSIFAAAGGHCLCLLRTFLLESITFGLGGNELN
jgi:hypothetical protein